MANYYTDIPELKYHLNNPMMERICELKERNYRDKEEFDYAPQDYADAMDSFDKVLEITGEITGEIIAPNAEGVDEEGPHCANGRVEYASGTKTESGCHGESRPERYDHAAPFRWFELPDHAVHHVRRNRGRRRCWIRKHLVVTRIVLKHYMNLETKTSTTVSFRVSAPVKPCLWT